MYGVRGTTARGTDEDDEQEREGTREGEADGETKENGVQRRYV
jgi:hypothetical protein